MKVIDGTWRECTPAERASLGVIMFECVRHRTCEVSRPDCVRRMVKLGAPVVGALRVTDKRRVR